MVLATRRRPIDRQWTLRGRANALGVGERATWQVTDRSLTHIDDIVNEIK
jgi:hypothetical protein